MIPFASQRSGGQDLATHLMNDYDNEVTEIAFIRGAVARDLHGAFKEWEVQAETLTRCRKYLYSLSINPDPAQGPLTRDQYLDYIGRTEEALGLRNQPRAVVFHVKEGREHCHVVWSRIDAENEKAVHLGFDRLVLMQVTREFARDHRLDLPSGYDKSRQVGQVSLYEQAQLQQGGLSKDQHKAQVTEAWKHRDDARSFVQALAERGYILASGDKRPYVLVDLYGGMNALPKLIDDKAVRTADVRAFLADEFLEDSLPSVEEAQALVSEYRKRIEQEANRDHVAERLAELKHTQEERRRTVDADRVALKQQHQALRAAQQAMHRAERDRLRADHVARMRGIRQVREERRSTGLAAFLGKVSGVALIQRAVHRYRDAQETKAYLARSAALKVQQVREQKELAIRQRVQGAEIERRSQALASVDAREQRALERDLKRDARVRARGGEEAMPSLTEIAGLEQSRERAIPDVLAAFQRRANSGHRKVPDLLSAFTRAARDRALGRDGDGTGASVENDRINGADPSRDGLGRQR